MKLKLRCINELNFTFITVGKIYDAEKADTEDEKYRDHFCVEIEPGIKYYYPSRCFMTIDEWRNESLNKILP